MADRDPGNSEPTWYKWDGMHFVCRVCGVIPADLPLHVNYHEAQSNYNANLARDINRKQDRSTPKPTE